VSLFNTPEATAASAAEVDLIPAAKYGLANYFELLLVLKPVNFCKVFSYISRLSCMCMATRPATRLLGFAACSSTCGILIAACRLAVVDQDWEHMRAVDLFVGLSSFLPKVLQLATTNATEHVHTFWCKIASC
jgi:hypothetical protein